jgi:hypothetical protein
MSKCFSMTGPGFDRRELAALRRLRTPGGVQRFLDEEIGYNLERDGDTCRSPRRVLRDRTAQCMEGALFGAAALRVLGYPPLLLDLEAVRDVDHVLAVFRERGHWGAVAKSNYAGLRFREPVYRTLRELVLSYFEHYYNLRGEKTLRPHRLDDRRGGPLGDPPVSRGDFPYQPPDARDGAPAQPDGPASVRGGTCGLGVLRPRRSSRNAYSKAVSRMRSYRPEGPPCPAPRSVLSRMTRSGGACRRRRATHLAGSQ